MMATNPTTAVTRPGRQELANALRALAMDAVQRANSGHPGAPMGMADLAEVLWNDFLQHNPADPTWVDRDRFVLSNGHGSMLLYGLLHLSGYPLSMADLRNFRQMGSPTAGHPEYEPDLGIETTTGPLGQGITNAVGMALAEKVLAAQFNRPEFPIVDHHTYAFLGDGCLMEGISHEACSYAGTLKLGKLICIYDDNGISIDGEVQGWFTDDTPARFRAYGWHVIADVDGHDPAAISAALQAARDHGDQPSLICAKTIIGFGAPNKQGTAATHGAPLGADEIAAARESLGWTEPPFSIAASVYDGWDATAAGAEKQAAWQELMTRYTAAHPELAAEFNRRVGGELPDDWAATAQKIVAGIDAAAENVATRKASLIALNAFGPALPELLGGSADLTGSNLTHHVESQQIDANHPDGNYLSYGVREFGMAAMMNGMALHGGFIPYAGTFLTFSDYSRNALRMSALMGIRTIHVFTHDSIGLGEDGPTHQPVEQVSSLRLIPGMRVWRPCDTVETAVAWQAAIENKGGPTSLILTRQSVPYQTRSPEQLGNVARGGYVLVDVESPAVALIATGSEVGLAVDAAAELADAGIAVRVVSMPCLELFFEQDEAYREAVLPKSLVKRVAIEAGSTGLWHRVVGVDGAIIGLDHFGASAPADELFKEFGFTPDNVAAIATRIMENE